MAAAAVRVHAKIPKRPESSRALGVSEVGSRMSWKRKMKSSESRAMGAREDWIARSVGVSVLRVKKIQTREKVAAAMAMAGMGRTVSARMVGRKRAERFSRSWSKSGQWARVAKAVRGWRSQRIAEPRRKRMARSQRRALAEEVCESN